MISLLFEALCNILIGEVIGRLVALSLGCYKVIVNSLRSGILGDLLRFGCLRTRSCLLLSSWRVCRAILVLTALLLQDFLLGIMQFSQLVHVRTTNWRTLRGRLRLWLRGYALSLGHSLLHRRELGTSLIILGELRAPIGLRLRSRLLNLLWGRFGCICWIWDAQLP